MLVFAISSERAQRVIFKGIRTLKTEELAETQKFYDGEECWKRHKFQYVFVLNWNKK